MANTLSWLLVPSLMLGIAACEPDIDVDENETGNGPVVEFDPGNKVIPFPNNLLLDPTTGKVNIPASCNESPAATFTRGFVNQLDGFATYEPTLYATFSAQFDVDTLPNRIVLYKRIGSTGPVDGTAATPIPTVTIPLLTVRYDADCANPQMIPQLIIVPTVPLEQKSVYTAAVLSGVTSDSGDAFGPSFTWSLVRQAEPPVVFDEAGNVTVNRTPLNPLSAADIATLQGLNLLYNVHKGALDFLADAGHDRPDVLLAWDFKTQTVTDPLDPAVATSPAANLGTPVPTGMTSLTCTAGAGCPTGINRAALPYSLCTTAPADTNNAYCFMAIALGNLAGATVSSTPNIFQVGNATCQSVGCIAIGDVLRGKMPAKQFQSQLPNSLAGGAAIPGPWSNPLTPTETVTEQVEFLAFVPATPRADLNTGYPTVIFGHGLGSTRKSMFAIASQLAVPRAAQGNPTGFLTIGIDFVSHDSRAVRISDTGTCANTTGPMGPGTVPPDPTGAGVACYAPFLSSNLAGTRDNIRQSVLDLHSLRNMIEGCGATNCDTTPFEGFAFDTAHVVYGGISLGGIMGSTFNATRTDMKAAALNVPGVGWVDILENTQTLAIRCSLVDGLIAAGILTGEPSSAGATALCVAPDQGWKTQPGYRQFATIGRWILDSADPANFTPKLATKRIFIQEVIGDQVVANVTTEREALLTGLVAPGGTPAQGACTPLPASSGGGPAAPTATLVTPPLMANKFIQYRDAVTQPQPQCNDATGTPRPTVGQVFEHASLLRPASGRCSITTATRCSVDAQCPGGETCSALSIGQGQLGTVRLQTDFITWLTLNK